MIKLVAIVGPTASGKSSLSIELAKRHNGEVVSCDSMQIYSGMEIGTAKATPDERAAVPHHMLDIVDPARKYSCSDYAKDAVTVINDIADRGKLPIVCGGTGLYLDALLYGSGTADMEFDPSYREGLEAISREADGREKLYGMLKEIDPEAAATMHMNNVKRVIRALEINRATGVNKAEWDRRSKEGGAKFEHIIIGLNYKDRDTLYRRIELRVDEMIKNGLVEETERLYRSGQLDPSYTAAQAIGYKEILPFVLGECTLDEAAEELKKATRRYAKRQLTWFSRYKEINWIYPDESEFFGINSEKTFEDIVNNAEKLFINYKKCSII